LYLVWREAHPRQPKSADAPYHARYAERFAILPFLVAGGLFAAFDLHLVRSREASLFIRSYGPESWDKCVVASRAIWFYFLKVVWPEPLMAVYPRWNLAESGMAAWLFPCAASVTALLGMLCFVKRRAAWAFYCAAFFALTLAPTLGFIPFSYMRYSFVADRFQYLACLGPIVLFGGSTQAIYNRAGARLKTLLRSAALCLVVLLAGLSARRAMQFNSKERLFAHDLALNPNSWIAHAQIGNSLSGQGRGEEAMQHFSESLRLNPDQGESHESLAYELSRVKRFAEAVPHYQMALTFPGSRVPHTFNNFAGTLLSLGRTDEAISSLEQALKIDPGYEPARKNLEKVRALRAEKKP
jgi:tetratricopeptide (TPR) repeat protein